MAKGSAGRRLQLVSTYYDTVDRALRRRGLVLRVRERDGRFVQTIKSDNAEASGPLARGEWEDAIPGPQPSPQAPESGQFLPSELAERLVPLFQTEVKRQAIDLSPEPDTRIEAAIDRGQIRARGRQGRERISEVELELKSGAASALYDVALDLLAVAPVRLEPRSKAERGYRLAATRSRRLATTHFEPPDLNTGMSGDEALQRIGIACLERLLRNEGAVRRRSTEGIHQMRVAVRRLRAVLSAFSRMLPTEQRRLASQELRWLADALGPARNLHVFAHGLMGRVPARLVEPAGLKALAAAVERRRKASYTAAVEAVRSPRYTGMILRLLRWFDACGWREDVASEDLRQPIGSLAARILDGRLHVVKQRGDDFHNQYPEQRHRLRIALKKLRYATEALTSLYDPEAVRPFVRQLKLLQDDLGEISDVRVARDIVTDLSRYSNATIAEAGNRVVEWHEEGLADREPNLRRHLDDLLEITPFWIS